MVWFGSGRHAVVTERSESSIVRGNEMQEAER